MGSVIRDDVDRVMSGRWTFAGVVDLPASTIDEAALKPGALIPAAKHVARCAVTGCRQAPGADVVAQAEIVHVAARAGVVASIEAAVDAAPTGGDKAVTIDIKKSTGGAAWASILTAAIVINAATSSRVAVAGVIDAAKAAYAAGDLFEVVATVSGATGDQAQGLAVTVFFEERPV